MITSHPGGRDDLQSLRPEDACFVVGFLELSIASTCIGMKGWVGGIKRVSEHMDLRISIIADFHYQHV